MYGAGAWTGVSRASASRGAGGSWCCRFAAKARRPCRRASREKSRRASPRAGASLDSSTPRFGLTSFERHLNLIDESREIAPWTFAEDHAEHIGAVRTLVASVRAAGSWKAHCISPHKQVLRLRSLVAQGRVKLPRTRRPRGRDARQKRALEFVVRQGDNGIVWNILSFWRATA